MATPIVYGRVESVYANGKAKLTCDISTKTKITVNRFDKNNELYIHINSRGKSISLAWAEFCDLYDVKSSIEEKIHFLTEVSQSSTI